MHRATHELLFSVIAQDRDSLEELHRQTFTGFAEAAMERVFDAPGDDLAALIEYGRTLGDTVYRARLMEGLTLINPSHPTLSEERVLEALRESAGEHQLVLPLLEQEWQSVGAANQSLATIGYGVATASAGRSEIREWGLRVYEVDPASRPGVAVQLAQVAGLEDVARRLLTEQLATLRGQTDPRRPVLQSLDQWRASTRRQEAKILSALGILARTEGRRAEAGALLEESLGRDWNLETAGALVDLIESEGGVADETRRLIAADPLAPSEYRTLRRDQLTSQRGELISRTVSISRSGDASEALARLTSDSAVVLVASFASVPGPDHPSVQRLGVAALQLAASGVRTLVVANSEWGEALVEVANTVRAYPVVDDGPISEALAGWVADVYTVLADGYFWSFVDLESALRLALLLASP
jgi:hypothetical protein